MRIQHITWFALLSLTLASASAAAEQEIDIYELDQGFMYGYTLDMGTNDIVRSQTLSNENPYVGTTIAFSRDRFHAGAQILANEDFETAKTQIGLGQPLRNPLPGTDFGEDFGFSGDFGIRTYHFTDERDAIFEGYVTLSHESRHVNVHADLSYSDDDNRFTDIRIRDNIFDNFSLGAIIGHNYFDDQPVVVADPTIPVEDRQVDDHLYYGAEIHYHWGNLRIGIETHHPDEDLADSQTDFSISYLF